VCFLVYCFFLYYVCFYLRVNKDEYITYVCSLQLRVGYCTLMVVYIRHATNMYYAVTKKCVPVHLRAVASYNKYSRECVDVGDAR